MRLCGAELGGLGFFEGNGYRIVSLRGPPERYYDGWDEGRVFPVLPNNPFARSSKQNRLSTSPTLRPMKLSQAQSRYRYLGRKRRSHVLASAPTQEKWTNRRHRHSPRPSAAVHRQPD